MPDNQDQIINLSELAKKLAQDLQELQQRAPEIKSLEDIRRLARLNNTASLLKGAAKQLRAELEKARQQHEAEVKERAEALERAVALRQEWLEAMAEARRAETHKPEEGVSVITGRIVDKDTRMPLPNVEVRAVAAAGGLPGLTATARTDELGYYRIVHSDEAFRELPETPEMRLEVIDEKGNTLHTSRNVTRESGGIEVIDAHVDASGLPTSRTLGEAAAEAVETELEGCRRRRRILISHGETRLGRPTIE